MFFNILYLTAASATSPTEPAHTTSVAMVEATNPTTRVNYVQGTVGFPKYNATTGDYDTATHIIGDSGKRYTTLQQFQQLTSPTKEDSRKVSEAFQSIGLDPEILTTQLQLLTTSRRDPTAYKEALTNLNKVIEDAEGKFDTAVTTQLQLFLNAVENPFNIGTKASHVWLPATTITAWLGWLGSIGTYVFATKVDAGKGATIQDFSVERSSINATIFFTCAAVALTTLYIIWRGFGFTGSKCSIRGLRTTQIDNALQSIFEQCPSDIKAPVALAATEMLREIVGLEIFQNDLSGISKALSDFLTSQQDIAITTGSTSNQ